MPVSRSTSRVSAVLGATLALVAIAGVVPASAAPVVTIDAIPGEPLLTPAAGPVTLVLSGDADAGTEVTIATDDIPSGVVTPICGPVTAGSDNRWTCAATDVADWVGQLRAYVFASPVYSTPVSAIAAPTLTGTPVTGTDTTPTISGTAPAGGVSTEIAVTVEGAAACTTAAAPGAAWSCDVPTGMLIADGAYEIGATQTKDFGSGEFRTSIATTTDYAQALEDLCRELTGAIGTIPLVEDILVELKCPGASAPVEGTLSLTLPAATGEIAWSAIIHSEPTVLGSGHLDADEPTTVELTIPASVPAGDHSLELVLVDEANPDVEPVSVRMPIALVAVDDPEPVSTPEPDVAVAVDPGIAAWPWLILALAVAAVIAASVLLVRRARS